MMKVLGNAMIKSWYYKYVNIINDDCLLQQVMLLNTTNLQIVAN